MKVSTFLLAALSLGQAALFAQPLRPNPTFSDANWVTFPGVPGLNGSLSALAFDAKDNLYVCGQFITAGGVVATNIAKWDGHAWSALDARVTGGQYPDIFALASDAVGNLYISGSFDSVGGVSATNIAKWDGKAWSALSSGVGGGEFPGYVSALAVDASGNVYAGGSFTSAGDVGATNIAKWDGRSWSSLGSGIVGAPVNALVCDRNGKLYAGGFFDTAGGVRATNIAQWDGTAWSALGTGVGGQYPFGVNALSLDASGDVYAGGQFTNAGPVLANNVAKWNGKVWSSLGSGTENAVSALGSDTNGNLYVGGYFTNAGEVRANYIAKWNGTNWSALNTGMDNEVVALTLDGRGNLYAGGWFNNAGGVIANYLAKWDGSTWSAPGAGTDSVNGSTRALTFDVAGNSYAAGHFSRLGGVSVTNLAKWDGITWSALGGGVGDISSTVYSLAFDNRGNLYAGGSFTTAGGQPATNIAVWNGTAWSALGAGVGDVGSVVRALVCDAKDNLYAGGSFDSVGGVSATNIAQWDGKAWAALSSGVGGAYAGRGVFALAFDANGNLYAGGSFTSAGGVLVTNIAKWKGTAWSAVAPEFGWNPSPRAEVAALALDTDGNLYIGENNRGIDTARFLIVKWDGITASEIPGMGPPPLQSFSLVNALAIGPSGVLYAGGSFSLRDTATKNIARWDGSAWSFLGSGMQGGGYQGVSALAFDTNQNLYVGGDFITAGTKVSAYIAKALLTGPTPNSLSLSDKRGETNIITYLGTPGVSYALDLASSLTPPVNWMAQVTNTTSTANATTAGYVMFINSNQTPQAFYRTRMVP